MKSMNLLPTRFKYDYSRVLVVKFLVLIVVMNVGFLVYAGALEWYNVRQLKQKLETQKIYLNQIKQLNAQLLPIEAEYDRLKKVHTALLEKETVFGTHFKSSYSPLVSTLIYLQTISKGIRIQQTTYNEGVFVINGEARNSDLFYRYYRLLESNKNLLDLTFYHFQSNQKDDDPVFEFKLKFSVRRLNEVY
jgi:Tfp pilus assembly protein PilN